MWGRIQGEIWERGGFKVFILSKREGSMKEVVLVLLKNEGGRENSN